MRLQLPSGESVDLRELDSLKSRDRDKVVSALTSAEKQGAAYIEVTQAVIATMVTSWTFTWPVPALAPQMLGELSIADRSALEEAVAPAIQVLFPSAKADGPTDPSSPPPASSD